MMIDFLIYLGVASGVAYGVKWFIFRRASNGHNVDQAIVEFSNKVKEIENGG